MARTKAFDEQVVLDCAVELFWDRGFEGTSVSDLEEHLGIGRQSLYNTFGDKREFFLRALSRYASRSGEMASDALGQPDSGWDSLKSYLHGVIDFQYGPGGRRACLVAKSILEFGARDRRVAGQCKKSQQHVLDQFRNVLERAKAHGDVPAQLNTEAGAATLMAQAYGFGVLARSGVAAPVLHAAVDALLSGMQSS